MRTTTPAAIATSPARTTTIFTNTIVKTMSAANATNNNPTIIAAKPSQFMNQFLSCSD
ncbi:hypothetical protein [Methanoregula sp.]|uniref:hypothetical protein n=1 Tax=Methanoregula sp. TaxID=2052170 RepID=UPI003BAF2FB3